MPEYRWRVSPSGPFIKDGVSNLPLPVGDGTTGRIWRTQGPDPGAASVLIGTNVGPPVGLVPEFAAALAWSLPVGYHYDLRVKFKINCTQPQTVGFFYIDVQFEQNSVWSSVVNYTVAPIPFAVEQHDITEGGNDETYVYSAENVDIDLSAATFPVTGVRALLTEDQDLLMAYLPQQSQLRIEQYVITAP